MVQCAATAGWHVPMTKLEGVRSDANPSTRARETTRVAESRHSLDRLDLHCDLEVAVNRVEMRRSVIAVTHGNDNTEEAAQFRHASL